MFPVMIFLKNKYVPCHDTWCILKYFSYLQPMQQMIASWLLSLFCHVAHLLSFSLVKEFGHCLSKKYLSEELVSLIQY